MPSLPRFLREHNRPGSVAIEVASATYRRNGVEFPAAVYRPRSAGRLPGWLVLHGLTATGLQHPSLVRFARSIAAGGNVVFIPEIPEWRQLHVAPAVTHDTILAAVRQLHDRHDVDPDRVGLFGFSFGATQALVAAADPAIHSLLHGLAAWGGYCDLHTLFVFGLTGHHELDGTTYRVRPDPYGTWIMVGNYLHRMPGYEEAADVAAALLALAREAGRVGAYAWDPVYDPAKQRLRQDIPAARRELFDMLAPPSGAEPGNVETLRPLALQLADTAIEVDPMMDPGPYLSDLGVRTILAHGRDDRLVPFSETVRLSRLVPPSRLRACTITTLFDHSGRPNRELGPFGFVTEGTRFIRLLRRILHLV